MVGTSSSSSSESEHLRIASEVGTESILFFSIKEAFSQGDKCMRARSILKEECFMKDEIITELV